MSPFHTPEVRDAIADARNAYIDRVSHPDLETRTQAAKDYAHARTKVARLLDTSFENAEQVILCLTPSSTVGS